MVKVRILKDSIAPNGARLTTWELTYARFAHAELLTHRAFSRNSASSRAIPVKKLLKQIIHNPAIPVHWGKNQAGMQARESLSGLRLVLARNIWLLARWPMVAIVYILYLLGLHKQVANRLIEPWMLITVILSATEYDNWFKLRDHRDAQPDIAELAHEMRIQYDKSLPELLKAGEWHLPMIEANDWDKIVKAWPSDANPMAKKISVARCARVSYLTHDTAKVDFGKDFQLHDSLAKDGHWSPFEHVAKALDKGTGDVRCGNFRGWYQYRKQVEE